MQEVSENAIPVIELDDVISHNGEILLVIRDGKVIDLTEWGYYQYIQVKASKCSLKDDFSLAFSLEKNGLLEKIDSHLKEKANEFIIDPKISEYIQGFYNMNLELEGKENGNKDLIVFITLYIDFLRYVKSNYPHFIGPKLYGLENLINVHQTVSEYKKNGDQGVIDNIKLLDDIQETNDRNLKNILDNLKNSKYLQLVNKDSRPYYDGKDKLIKSIISIRDKLTPYMEQVSEENSDKKEITRCVRTLSFIGKMGMGIDLTSEERMIDLSKFLEELLKMNDHKKIDNFKNENSI